MEILMFDKPYWSGRNPSRFLVTLLASTAFISTAGATPWLPQKVVASDGAANAWFGSQTVVSGNTAFISAPNATVSGRESQGTVYVFTKSGITWSQTQILEPSDAAAGMHFGAGIAVNGNTAVITAPIADQNGVVWQGCAYVFVRLGTTWVYSQKLTSDVGVQYDTFGNSVAMNANYLLISSGGSTTVGPGGSTTIPRAVHIFTPSIAGAFGPDWAEVQEITSPVVDGNYGSFGGSMAVGSDSLLIGARSATVAGSIGRGSVYVYKYNGSAWTMADNLTASDGAARDNFGVSISIDGTTAMIGAPGAATNGNTSQGAVYAFNETSGVWLQQQKLLVANGAALSLFGASVSLSGNWMLSGAYGVNNREGAAYLFRKNGTSWIQDQALVPTDLSPGDVLGYNTGLDGGTALVGAFNATVNGAISQGAAYFYTNPCYPNPTICIAAADPEPF
jgi:hypothetical protein